ncbi:MAG: M48 family metallopeptidase [Verrucomicrobiota bacterium]
MKRSPIPLVNRLVAYSSFFFALFALVSCVQLSETGQNAFIITTPQQEMALGTQAFNDLKSKMKVSDNSAKRAQVKRVADRLKKVVSLPGGEWEVVLFDEPTPNAFALPGGKIGVHTGILPLTKTDAGLAVVIGHELAHVTLRHGGQRMSQQAAVSGAATLADLFTKDSNPRTRQITMAAYGLGAQYGLILPYSRTHEYEADRYGMIYMAKAGYNPEEAIAFWKRMIDYSKKRGGKPLEFLSTHPADHNRIAKLKEHLPSALNLYKLHQ